MRFGTNHAFQLPPGRTVAQVYAEEFERIKYAEELGYQSVWLPEQHFFDYCISPDALDLAGYVVGVTSRVRVGTAVVNLSLTHPLRFAERAAMLDLVSGGRVDICVGRGYQLPQNVAFGVAEDATKPMFAEALDIILNTWTDGPSGFDGEHYSFPPVRTFPPPQRPANEILIYGVGATTPIEETIRRGLPLGLSQPFGPVAKTAAAFEEYVAALHASPLRDDEVERLLDRAFVLVYAMVAPTVDEARDISKRPFEWHNARLAALRTPVPSPSEWREHYYDHPVAPTEIDDADWNAMTSDALLFTDPEGMADHMAVLRDAGVRNVVPWMGVGGVTQRHVLRSMRLFAEHVMPKFTD
ncbi:LLM class flavin-dependent oxidoreductase [Mycolicibacterium hodleri]|nr:LLM class flavin-dependent oxidoreductase [Mycolicibacterium hodleri]